MIPFESLPHLITFMPYSWKRFFIENLVISHLHLGFTSWMECGRLLFGFMSVLLSERQAYLFTMLLLRFNGRSSLAQLLIVPLIKNLAPLIQELHQNDSPHCCQGLMVGPHLLSCSEFRQQGIWHHWQKELHQIDSQKIDPVLCLIRCHSKLHFDRKQLNDVVHVHMICVSGVFKISSKIKHLTDQSASKSHLWN